MPVSATEIVYFGAGGVAIQTIDRNQHVTGEVRELNGVAH